MVLNDKSGREMSLLLSKLTTNHTYFMREPEHFKFFTETFLPECEQKNKNKSIRIWSAGCSSGEEPYTIAMTLADYFGAKKKEWNTKILATDISLRVLDKAKNAIYSDESLKDVPAMWKNKYFTNIGDGCVEVKQNFKDEVVLKQLNLMSNFVFPQPFDIIWCRNVMIYFDTPTKNALVNKYYKVLKPGGYLFIGHAETIAKDATKFKYVMPAIYKKEG